MQLLLKTLARVPRVCVWELTTACNLRCVHCECSAGSRRRDELCTREALELCDALGRLGTERVSLSGGEPLLRRDWQAIAARLTELGMRVQIITNGLCFDAAAAAACVAIGIDGVAVSIDGLMATHDSIRRYPARVHGASPFRRAFEALALARSKGLRTSVITHVNGRNLAQLGELHALLALVPIDGWQVQLGCPQGRMRTTEAGYLLEPEQLPELVDFVRSHQDAPFPIRTTDEIGYFTARELDLRRGDGSHPYWVGCYAGILMLAIERNGAVKGCPSLPAAFVEGNIRDRPLDAIWHDPTRFAYNRQWDSRRLRGFCRRCDFRNLCRAGCRSFALASTGSIYENRHCLYRLQAERRARP